MNLLQRLTWVACCLVFIGLCLPAGVAAQAEANGPEIYREEVRPLTTLECARCHFSVFTEIRDHGGRHQLACGFCHQAYHTWRPGRPWSEVVPQCGSCHGDFHGPAFQSCLGCHTNAHAPLDSLTDMEVLAQACGTCHAPQAEEVRQFPSAHTEVACNECHYDRHGTIPTCLECHAEPHTPFQDNSGCLGCHPVHAPLQITYGDEVANPTCEVCHQGVAKTMDQSSQKHAALYCVYCHADRHRFVPSCRDCHAQPHKQSLLQKFSGCGECHGDPHALKLSE